MDLTAVGAAVTSLRAAGDVAKGLMSLHTMAEVQSVAIQLNEKIIDAQHRIFEANAAQTALIERIRALEDQIAAVEDWNTEKQRYRLATPYSGVTVYALQKAMSNGEPPHYLCANCFQNRKRAILANTTQKDGFAAIICAACKFTAATRWRGIGSAQYAEDIQPPG